VKNHPRILALMRDPNIFSIADFMTIVVFLTSFMVINTTFRYEKQAPFGAQVKIRSLFLTFRSPPTIPSRQGAKDAKILFRAVKYAIEIEKNTFLELANSNRFFSAPWRELFLSPQRSRRTQRIFMV
jgi:hypothetical protein